MGENRDTPPTSPAAGEWLSVVVGLGLLIGLQLILSSAGELFRRHFWLDEILTHTLVADPSMRHALAALAGGVETHPPTYYLLLRGFTAAVRHSDETALRWFSLLSTVAALAGIFGVLRRSYAPWAALAGVLAGWSNPIVLLYAFEARSYATWLAAVAWLIYFLTGPPRRSDHLGLAGCAILVCTLHYLGILALLLSVAGAWSADRGLLRRDRLLALAAGPLSLAACVPLLLAQRSALPAASWMKRPDLAAAVAFVRQFLDLWLVLALGGIVCLLRGPASPGRRLSGGVAGLLALGALPLVCIVFSWTVQPVLMPRYALPALAAAGAAVALTLARFPRAWAMAACGCLAVTGAYKLRGEMQAFQARDRVTDSLLAIVRLRTDQAPVTFELSDPLFVAARYAPDIADRCYYLDFPQQQIGYANPSPAFAVGLARAYERYYGRPRAMPLDRLRRLRPAYLVLDFMPRPDVESQEPYPGLSLRPIESGLYELVPSGPRASR